ncbi:MAG: class II aldolase/adducin family protein [Candidatus Zixiibacteriota bacterium]
MPTEDTIRQQICSIGQSLHHQGMIAGTGGNISSRLSGDVILITPSGLPKWSLEPEMIIRIDLEGRILDDAGKPSSETLMHLEVYRRRADISACVHSHPPYSTAFAVAGIPLAENVLPETVLAVGHAPLTDYAAPGTEAVAASIAPYLGTSYAFLLRNHGLLTIGRSLDEAYHRHEMIEHSARIQHIARQLGQVDVIPEADMCRLEGVRSREYEDDR